MNDTGITRRFKIINYNIECDERMVGDSIKSYMVLQNPTIGSICSPSSVNQEDYLATACVDNVYRAMENGRVYEVELLGKVEWVGREYKSEQYKVIREIDYKREMDLDALNGAHLSILLSSVPEIEEYITNWGVMSGFHWSLLLPTSPHLYKYVPTNRLSLMDWCSILKKSSHLFDECPYINVLSGSTWASLLARDINYLPHLPEKDIISTDDMVYMITRNPNIKDYFPNWNKDFTQRHWLAVLKKHPILSKHVYDWYIFDNESWVSLLCSDILFDDYINGIFIEWDTFSSNQWCLMLLHQPNLYRYILSWDIIESKDWVELLIEHPKFAEHVKYLGCIKSKGWDRIIKHQPHIIRYRKKLREEHDEGRKQ